MGYLYSWAKTAEIAESKQYKIIQYNTSATSKIRYELTCFLTGINSLVQIWSSVRSSMHCAPANDVIGIFITYLLCRFVKRKPVNNSKKVSERTLNLNLNCLLATCQNDNHSPGSWALTREVNLATSSSAPSAEEIRESGSEFQSLMAW